MISTDDLQRLSGATAYSNDGDKLGKISQLYLDDQNGQPEWATVTTGMLGTKESFVPLAQASVSNGELYVPYDKNTVKGAPPSRSTRDICPSPRKPTSTATTVSRLLRSTSRRLPPSATTSPVRPPTTR